MAGLKELTRCCFVRQALILEAIFPKLDAGLQCCNRRTGNCCFS